MNIKILNPEEVAKLNADFAINMQRIEKIQDEAEKLINESKRLVEENEKIEKILENNMKLAELIDEQTDLFEEKKIENVDKHSFLEVVKAGGEKVIEEANEIIENTEEPKQDPEGMYLVDEEGKRETLTNKHCTIELNFDIKKITGDDNTDPYNMPAFISRTWRSHKKAWNALVQAFDKDTTMGGAQHILNENGIRTHSWCRMD